MQSVQCMAARVSVQSTDFLAVDWSHVADLVAVTDAQNLWCHILWGATHGGQHCTRSKELGQAEVSNLDGCLVCLVCHEHVLQLQIPVHNACAEQ